MTLLGLGWWCEKGNRSRGIITLKALTHSAWG